MKDHEYWGGSFFCTRHESGSSVWELVYSSKLSVAGTVIPPTVEVQKDAETQDERSNLFEFTQPGSGGVWAHVSVSIARY